MSSSIGIARIAWVAEVPSCATFRATETAAVAELRKIERGRWLGVLP
jgi:hypothetical protein